MMAQRVGLWHLCGRLVLSSRLLTSDFLFSLSNKNVKRKKKCKKESVFKMPSTFTKFLKTVLFWLTTLTVAESLRCFLLFIFSKLVLGLKDRMMAGSVPGVGRQKEREREFTFQIPTIQGRARLKPGAKSCLGAPWTWKKISCSLCVCCQEQGQDHPGGSSSFSVQLFLKYHAS